MRGTSGDAGQVKFFDTGRVGRAKKGSNVIDTAEIVEKYGDGDLPDTVVRLRAGGNLKWRTFIHCYAC
jgi:hypothetical protein